MELWACCALALLSVAPVCAVTVDVGTDDPVVVFAADELKRILGAASNRIMLREDASLEAQQWRLRSAQDGTLVIFGRDDMGIAYGVFTFLEKHVGVRWRDFAEGRHQDAYEMLTDIFTPAHV